ncbi:type 2 isopentenyl-diphosphate Delta-isomerase [Nocardia sp. NPDC005825]|uniref:type 2 isopentenyl-diphosphate Delta-isomerase n=1 Tax=unclassified Nocardia TaxID=2637762 RepID=UPI0033EB1B97
MIGSRKDEHVSLAIGQRRNPPPASDFDDVVFVHHALRGINREDVVLDTEFAGVHWRAPLYINAMTGGTARTGAINRDLAIAARETGLAIATGSMSAFFADPDTAATFRIMREVNPAGFIMANVNATTSVENALRAIDLVAADALQIHLNAIQEIVMPEGDRSFADWSEQIARIAAAAPVPVFVKEVGFGLSRETVTHLRDLGVRVADVGGRGGTNFARIENDRRTAGEYRYLADWGQSAAQCLIETYDVRDISLLASGGVRNPLDVARSLALGAVAAGVSGRFLQVLVEEGLPTLITEIGSWLEQLTSLMTVLGANTPGALRDCDLVVVGGLQVACAARGVDPIRFRDQRRSDPTGATGTRSES